MTAALPAARSAPGAAGLRALLERPEAALFGFDFDGTLAPIVTDPSAARIHPDIVPALARIAPRVAGVAIVTGRPVKTVLELGGFTDAGVDLGRLVVAGHYGAERWTAATGAISAPATHPGVARVRAALPHLLAEVAAPPGTAIEDKQRSLAVHVRNTADPTAAMVLLRDPLATLAADSGLRLEPGRMVLELRPADANKGAALRDLVAELDAGCVLFAGDDLGDLAAYDAVEELRAEGFPGVLVCAASTEVDALSGRADLLVDGPAGIAELLRALADQLG